MMSEGVMSECGAAHYVDDRVVEQSQLVLCATQQIAAILPLELHPRMRAPAATTKSRIERRIAVATRVILSETKVSQRSGNAWLKEVPWQAKGT
jgi:hypothetical protein